MNIEVTKKGFTLLEVLVSSAIFAVVMIITTATVAQSSNYKNKLNTLRELNEDSRLLSDTITRDIRSASEPLKVSAMTYDISPLVCNSGGPFPDEQKTYKNGIALFAWRNDPCFEFNNFDSPSGQVAPTNFTDQASMLASLESNAMVISTKDSYIVYLSGKDIPFGGVAEPYYHVFRRVIPKTELIDGILDYSDIRTAVNESYILSSKNVETYVNFGGFAPDDITSSTLTNAQPYINFYLNSRTKDYASKQVYERAAAQIRSTVTSRSYNP